MAKKMSKNGGHQRAGGKNPYKAKKERQVSRCPVCGAPIKMIPESEMGFRFESKSGRKFEFYWVCSKYPECNTYCPADNSNKKPWGVLAGPSLRYKHMAIHHWENHMVKYGFYSREGFRSLCSYLVGTKRACMTHVRNMTEMECDTILSYMLQLYRTNQKVHDSVEAEPNSTMWKEARGLNTGANHGIRYTDDGQVEEILDDTPEKEAERSSTVQNCAGKF